MKVICNKAEICDALCDHNGFHEYDYECIPCDTVCDIFKDAKCIIILDEKLIFIDYALKKIIHFTTWFLKLIHRYKGK